MMDKLFELALGIAAPWSVSSGKFDESVKLLTVLIDFKPGTRFTISGYERARGHNDVTLAADAERRRVRFVTEGRDAKMIQALAGYLDKHGCPAEQINSVSIDMLKYGCTCVMRSKVAPMKEVAALVRRPIEGIVAWAQTRQTNGFLEAINGLFQAAKRRVRGFTRLSTIKTVLFLIAGKRDFRAITSHGQPLES